ncbi:MAG TPA: SOS response-associated peptidase [Thermomicrobiales bacterium]|nr:SOS response-associated peptidase [Thermomicrobiales bacterium]
MCGRFAVIRQLEELARLFEAGLIRMEGDFAPNYNVAPSTIIPAVIEEDGQRVIVGLYWGFTPSWAKARKDGPRPINARKETVATSGMFRNAFRRRRAIIPADGFFEWKAEGTGKQPFFIHRADGDVMAFAGIWERWQDPTGELETPLDSCAIITTNANDEMAQLHDRMPVILEPEEWDRWLDAELTDAEALADLLDPAEDHVIAYHPVTPDVGNVRNNRPDLIEPLEQTRFF